MLRKTVNTPVTDKNRKEFQKRGWTLFPSVLSVAEVDELREYARITAGEGNVSKAGDLLTHPGLDKYIKNKKIIQILKDLTGNDVIYYGESGFFYCKDPIRNWHTDDPANYPTRHLQKDYSLLRVGLYLQDHRDTSGGLKIKSYSHKYFTIPQYLLAMVSFIKGLLTGKKVALPSPSLIRWGTAVNIPNATGDIAVWDLRTKHSPWAVRLKLFPWLSLHPNLENIIPEFLKKPAPKKRSLITASYAGKEDETLSRYFKYLGGRKDYINHWNSSNWDPNQKAEELRDYGISLKMDCFERSREIQKNNS